AQGKKSWPMSSHAKSPAWISTQATAVDHTPHRLVVNPDAFDRPTYHWPFCKARAIMSDLPSPLKSPTCTSTQLAPVLQVSQRVVVKLLDPLDKATYH